MRDRVAAFFRKNSVTIGLVIILGAFMAILYLQSVAVNKLQEQVAGQQRILNEVRGVATALDKRAGERTKQIEALDRHLDCIVVFFAQPDRSQKAIEDIDQCTLRDFNNGQVTRPTGGVN